MRKKNQITYTQMDLYKEVAELYQGTYTLNDVRNIAEKLEEVAKDHLAEAEEEHSIQVKIFNGISILSWLVPAQKDAKVFGANIDVDDYIRIKPNITQYLKRQINKQAFGCNK